MIEPFKGDAGAVSRVSELAGNVASGIAKLGDQVAHSHKAAGTGRAHLQAVRDAVAHDATMQRENRNHANEMLDKILGHSKQEADAQRAAAENLQNREVEHTTRLAGLVEPGTETEMTVGRTSFRGTIRRPAVEKPAISPAEERANAMRARQNAAVRNSNPSTRVSTPTTPAMTDRERIALLTGKVASNAKNRTQFKASEPVDTKTKVMPVVSEDTQPLRQRASERILHEEPVNIGDIKPAQAAED